jgi:hypothetical protein
LLPNLKSFSIAIACIFKAGSEGSFLITKNDHQTELDKEEESRESVGEKFELLQIRAFDVSKVFVSEDISVEDSNNNLISSAVDNNKCPLTVIDTTGCGDNYCAGFIAAISRGWALPDCCRYISQLSLFCLVQLLLIDSNLIQTRDCDVSALRHRCWI